MHFSSGINCPPYETADAYLQVTRGCSHNSCTFCTMYRDVPFGIESFEQSHLAVNQRCGTDCSQQPSCIIMLEYEVTESSMSQQIC